MVAELGTWSVVIAVETTEGAVPLQAQVVARTLEQGEARVVAVGERLRVRLRHKELSTLRDAFPLWLSVSVGVPRALRQTVAATETPTGSSVYSFDGAGHTMRRSDTSHLYTQQKHHLCLGKKRAQNHPDALRCVDGPACPYAPPFPVNSGRRGMDGRPV